MVVHPNCKSSCQRKQPDHWVTVKYCAKQSRARPGMSTCQCDKRMEQLASMMSRNILVGTIINRYVWGDVGTLCHTRSVS